MNQPLLRFERYRREAGKLGISGVPLVIKSSEETCPLDMITRYVSVIHDCLGASSQEDARMNLSFRVKIIEICHHVAIWMREIESCPGMKMKWRKKNSHISSAPSEASKPRAGLLRHTAAFVKFPSGRLLSAADIRRGEFITLNHLVFPPFRSSPGSGAFPENTSVPRFLHFPFKSAQWGGGLNFEVGVTPSVPADSICTGSSSNRIARDCLRKHSANAPRKPLKYAKRPNNFSFHFTLPAGKTGNGSGNAFRLYSNGKIRLPPTCHTQ